jgi:dihydrofolate reductase
VSVVSLVLARADNGVIGDAGRLPWRLPDDLRRFKALTIGKPCIMGRKTWESLPKKPLPGRTNIVVTRDMGFQAEGAQVAHSLDTAFALAGEAQEICIIGGTEIYRASLTRATRIHLTEIHAAFAGDTTMAPFAPPAWRETAREEHATAEGLRYSYVTLERERDGSRGACAAPSVG